jgi:hypothetical protein
VNVRRGNEVMLERDNADKLVSAVGAQSMYVLIAGAGHEDAEFVPPAITETVAASTSAAVLANGNARSGRMGVTGFTEDQRSISVAFRHQAQGPRETSHRGPNARTDETGRRWWGPSGRCCPQAGRHRNAFPREAWVKYRTLRETIRYTDPTTGFDGLCIPCGLVVWQRCPDERVPSMLATQQGPDRHLGPEGAGALLIL